MSDQERNSGRSETKKLAIASLGSIGLEVARRIDKGEVPHISLSQVSARDIDRAREKVSQFNQPPQVVPVGELGGFDILLECAPAAIFEAVVEKGIENNALILTLSVGALLERMELVESARAGGARITVPTGALLGLDAVNAARHGTINAVKLKTTKNPRALAGAPYLETLDFDISTLTEPTMIFSGSAREAAKGFPANVNVGAALALAGIGPDKTEVEIWADPSVTRNMHNISMQSDSSNLSMSIENIQSETNPGTGKITALSAIAALERLSAPLFVGT